MRTYNFILILFILNISQCFTSIIIVSDLVKPFEYCNEKKECEQIGIDGEVECINPYCACVNNTKYQKHLRGCFRNIGFGDVCNVTPECVTPGSICGYTNCEKEDSYKRCVCNDDAEFIHGSCKPSRARKCCLNSHCNVENMYCNTDTHKCECKPKYYSLSNMCVSHIDINICENDDDCSHIVNSKCSKVKNTSISKCECKPNFHFFNNTCVLHNICSDNKQCGNNEFCYLLSNSEYGICYEGLICKDNEINIDNQCISIEEKLCNNDTDCKETEICHSISINNIGICIQGNFSVFNESNETDMFKAEILTHGIRNAGNKKNHIFVFLYLIKYYFVFNYFK